MGGDEKYFQFTEKQVEKRKRGRRKRKRKRKRYPNEDKKVEF